MEEHVKINFSDERDEGLSIFARLVDPILLDEFIKNLKNSSEQRSLPELLTDWLEGR